MNLPKASCTGKSARWLAPILLVILLVIAFLSGCAQRPQVEHDAETPDMPGGSPTTLASPPPTSASVFISPLATPLPGISLSGKFVFHSDVGGVYNVYTMQGDGKNTQQLTFSGGRNIEPTWSPDGKLVAFASDRDDAAGLNIYVMNADGSDQHALTNHEGYALSPSWSPDGKKLVFHTNWEVKFQLYTVDLEGGEPQKLFDFPANAYMPDWSPDGSQVAFVGDRDGGNDDIYVATLDDGEIRRLTDNFEREIRPRWSPDGTRLVYQRYDGEDIDIVVRDMETDEEIFSVLDDQYRDSMPAWVEGEKYLVVSSSINESPWALNIIDFDGNRYLLTGEGGSLRYAQWTK